MPLPGLTFAGGGHTVYVPSGTSGFSLASALGNPSGPVAYGMIALSGSIGGPDASTPSIDASTGMHVDSVGIWIISEDVRGYGGDGGDGYRNAASVDYSDGGGGGGGSTVGSGGDGNLNSNDGADGTADNGGLAGGGAAGSNTDDRDATNGAPAGHAITLSHTVYVTLGAANLIGGGGGGGGGGGAAIVGPRPSPGGDGGDLGAAGQNGGGTLVFGTGGAAGYAIKYTDASASATVSGGTVHGTVGL